MAKKVTTTSSTEEIKVKEPTLAEKLRKLDQISDKINSNSKSIVCGRLSKEKKLADSLNIEWIRTPSENVNLATGGGFPKGRHTIIAGKKIIMQM